MRRVFAAFIMLAMIMGGGGRASAAASSAEDGLSSIPGLTIVICHADAGDVPDQPGPEEPAQDHCCELCALCAPILLPEPPLVPGVLPEIHEAERATLVVWMVRSGHVRTPRQSQGPPVA